MTPNKKIKYLLKNVINIYKKIYRKIIYLKFIDDDFS